MEFLIQKIFFFLLIMVPMMIVLSSSLIFVIRDKKEFFQYMTIVLHMILALVIILEFKRYLYSGNYSLGYLTIYGSTFIFLLSTSIRLFINYIRNEKRETLVYYIFKEFSNFFYSLLKTIIIATVVIFMIIQLFLIVSAFQACNQAKELNYIDNNQSIWSFYSPTVKAIEFQGKRYSYRRGKYVEMKE